MISEKVPPWVPLTVAALALAGCASRGVAPSQSVMPADQEVHAAFTALLARGAAAWNRGDLDGFMDDYTDDATFITSRGVVRGRAAIRALYAPRFAPGARRDSLRFEGIEVDVMGPDAAHGIAWYVLMRGDSVTARGPTSLVLLREASGRWRIVHDHSS